MNQGCGHRCTAPAGSQSRGHAIVSTPLAAVAASTRPGAAFAGAPADFPILDDTSLNVAKLYDMLPAEAYLPDGRTPADSATVRTVFIIGPDKKVRLTMTYPMSVGRNFAEIIRALDAVQKTDGASIATPADWQPGNDVIVGLGLDDEAARLQFGDIDIKFPYLRFTKDPATS